VAVARRLKRGDELCHPERSEQRPALLAKSKDYVGSKDALMKRLCFVLLNLIVFASVPVIAGAAAPRPSPTPAGLSYNIRLATIHPYATRARRADTVFAQLAVYVNGVPKGSVAWNGTCDDNACPNRAMSIGSYNLGLGTSVDTGPVRAQDEVKWTYEVVSTSRVPDQVQLETASTALGVSTCTDPWPCAIAGATNVFGGWTFSGCDGPVAVDAVMRTGTFLAAHITSGEWGYDRRYVGSNPPRGCGVSDYQIVSIVKQVK
jgi:hypothetical protein